MRYCRTIIIYIATAFDRAPPGLVFRKSSSTARPRYFYSPRTAVDFIDVLRPFMPQTTGYCAAYFILYVIIIFPDGYVRADTVPDGRRVVII